MRLGVSFGPDRNDRLSGCPVARIFTEVPPTSMTSTLFSSWWLIVRTPCFLEFVSWSWLITHDSPSADYHTSSNISAARKKLLPPTPTAIPPPHHRDGTIRRFRRDGDREVSTRPRPKASIRP